MYTRMIKEREENYDGSVERAGFFPSNTTQSHLFVSHVWLSDIHLHSVVRGAATQLTKGCSDLLMTASLLVFAELYSRLTTEDLINLFLSFVDQLSLVL